MRRSPRSLLSLCTFAALLAPACGPQAPADPDSTTTADPEATSGSAATGDSTPTTLVTDAGSTSTTGSTGLDTSAAASSTGDSPGSSGPGSSTTGEAVPVCPSAGICEENEHCTPEARLNADISGTTPLGPFSGTFAFVSAALAFGELGTLYVVPAYAAAVCDIEPMLQVELGSIENGEDFVIEAPVILTDGQGGVVQASATVQVSQCCRTLWFCDCANPTPYEVEISVVADGWSLAGSARPNCCRSYSIDEAA